MSWRTDVTLARGQAYQATFAGATAWCASQYAAFIYVARVTAGADAKPDLSRAQPLQNVGQAGPLTLTL